MTTSIETEIANNKTLEEQHEVLVNDHVEPSHNISHEATLYAEPIIHIGSFSITNALLTSWIVVFIIIIISIIIKSRLKEVPRKLQNIFEIILNGALSLCDQITNNRKISLKIFPLALSVFIFVLLNNWIGITPLGGFGILETHNGSQSFIPFLRSGTADINGTLALGILSIIGANLFGVFSIGLWKTFNKYFNIKGISQIFTKITKDPTVLVVAPINFFVGVIELIGEFAKIASLSLRLFGNVFAGEVLLLSIGAIFAYGFPIPFLFLEILVGAIQAFIFAVLVVVYFTIASHDHEHDEKSEEHHKEKQIQTV